MRPDGGGGTDLKVSLFAYHTPYGYSVTAEGAAVQKTAGDVANFKTDVKTKHNAARAGVAGVIAEDMPNAPAAVMTNAMNLMGTAMSSGGSIVDFGSAIDTFNAKVTQLNNILYSTSPDKQEAKKKELWGQYNAANQALTQAGLTAKARLGKPLDPDTVKALYAAGAMPSYVANAFPTIDFTGVNPTKLPSDILAMTPEEQAKYVKDHPELDPKIAQLVDPAAKQILAEEVAQNVKDKKVDETTVRLLTLYQGDQAFAHQLYTSVSPDDIAREIKVLSDTTFPASTQPLDQAQKAKIYSDFLDAMGVTLATYSTASGAYAPPSNLADTWFKAITDTFNPQNAAALTLLIKRGGHRAGFDPTFLSDLTDKTYDWEKSSDGRPVWGPLNDQLGQGYGIKDPSFDFGDPNDPYDDQASYRNAYDGLANLLAGMEKTPQASEMFFADSGTTDVDGQQVNEKLHYLLSERRWPVDDGDGFGKALEGATTFDRGNDEAGKQSASLASQTVFIIGNDVGRGDSWRPGDDGWQIPSGMTDSVGKMVASYTPDSYRIAQGNGEEVSGGDWVWGDSAGESGGGPFGLIGSNEDLAKTLQSLGRGDDKTGMEYVTTAALDYHNKLDGTLIDQAVMPDGSKPHTIADLQKSNLGSLLDDEAAKGGKTLSFLVNNGFLGGKADEAASQEERDAMAKAFGVATSFIPGPEGKILGPLTSVGLSEVGDMLGQQPDSVTDAWASDSDKAIKESLSFQTYNQLLNHGFLGSNDPAGIPADAVKTDADGNKYIDPNLYNGSGKADSVTQKEFNSWLASTSSPAGLGEKAIDAYSSNLPNFS